MSVSALTFVSTSFPFSFSSSCAYVRCEGGTCLPDKRGGEISETDEAAAAAARPSPQEDEKEKERVCVVVCCVCVLGERVSSH